MGKKLNGFQSQQVRIFQLGNQRIYQLSKFKMVEIKEFGKILCHHSDSYGVKNKDKSLKMSDRNEWKLRKTLS